MQASGTAGSNAQWGNHCGEYNGSNKTKTKNKKKQKTKPRIPLLGRYHIKVNAEAGPWSPTPVWLIAAEASVISKGRSKPCPSMDNWTNEMLYLPREE